MKLHRTTVVKAVRGYSPKLAWVLLAVSLLSGAAAHGAELGIVCGPVEVGRGQPTTWRPAKSGQELSPGDRVRTGRGAHAEILLDAGTVRLYSNSVLRLPATLAADSGRDAVTLDRGRSLLDVIRRLSGRLFQVNTPEVVVSVKGTRFSVDLTGELASVAVFRGTVGVRELGAELALETLVREGFAATGGPGVPFELELAPEIDPWDLWEKGPDDAELSSGGLEQPSDRKRHSLSAARETARRVTSEDVLKHAVRRNPDVADRLRELVARKKVERQVEGRAAKQAPSPAAPSPAADATDWNKSMPEPQDYPPEPPVTAPGGNDGLPDDGVDDLSFNWGQLSEMLSSPNSDLIPALLARDHTPIEVRYTLTEVKREVFTERQAAQNAGVEIDPSWVESTLTQEIIDAGWDDGDVGVVLDHMEPLFDEGG